MVAIWWLVFAYKGKRRAVCVWMGMWLQASHCWNSNEVSLTCPKAQDQSSATVFIMAILSRFSIHHSQYKSIKKIQNHNTNTYDGWHQNYKIISMLDQIIVVIFWNIFGFWRCCSWEKDLKTNRWKSRI